MNFLRRCWYRLFPCRDSFPLQDLIPNATIIAFEVMEEREVKDVDIQYRRSSDFFHYFVLQNRKNGEWAMMHLDRRILNLNPRREVERAVHAGLNKLHAFNAL